MNGKSDFLTKIIKHTKKIFKSFEYWEIPFSFEVVAPQLRFVILTLGFIIVYLTLSIIFDIKLEKNILFSLIFIIVSLIITRAFSHILIIYTTTLLIIFLFKLSFMDYTLGGLITDYENFFKSANPIEYFKSTKSYSEKINTLIIKQLNNSDKMREFSLVSSTKYFNSLFEKHGMPARYLSAYLYVNQHWRFVEENTDHIFSPKFQLNLFEKEGYLAGDCDDFTVFLASVFRCLEPVDLVITSMSDHVFLELRISGKEELTSYKKIISLLFDVNENDIYFEIDKKGYWLSFGIGDHPGYKYDRALVISRMEIN